MNYLEYLINKYSDKPWCWYNIAQNYSITMDFIKDIIENPEIKFDKRLLLLNESIDPEYIMKYLKKIDWHKLSKNRQLKTSTILNNLDRNWDWKWLSQNKIITLDFINNNPHLPFNWSYLSLNPNITQDFVLEHYDKNWNPYYLLCNTNISPTFVKKIFDYKLDPQCFSRAIEIGGSLKYDEFVNIDLIDLDRLSKNNNLDIKILENNLDLNWNYYHLSSNEIIKPDFIEKNIEKDWDWTEISKNTNLNRNFINKYYSKLDKEFLFKNICFTQDLIDKYIGNHSAKIDYIFLSENSNMSMEFIEKNLNKFDYKLLSNNHFNYRKIRWNKITAKYFNNSIKKFVFNILLFHRFTIPFKYLPKELIIIILEFIIN